MERIKLRDFFLGIIASCLLLITLRVYDSSPANRAYADEPAQILQVQIVGQNKPLEIQSQPKPVRVELVRQNGFSGQYVSVIDEKGAINTSGAIPVEIMTRDGGQYKAIQTRNGVLRTATY